MTRKIANEKVNTAIREALAKTLDKKIKQLRSGGDPEAVFRYENEIELFNLTQAESVIAAELLRALSLQIAPFTSEEQIVRYFESNRPYWLPETQSCIASVSLNGADACNHYSAIREALEKPETRRVLDELLKLEEQRQTFVPQNIETIHLVAGVEPGVNGIGEYYRKAYEKDKHALVIGIARNGDTWQLMDNKVLKADLGNTLDQRQLYDDLRTIFLSRINRGPLRVILTYIPGPFEKLEASRSMDDQERIKAEAGVYDVNYTALKELAGAVEEIIKERKMRFKDEQRIDLVGFSTIALRRDDSENFPTYSSSKLLVEKFIKDFSNRSGSDGVKRSGLVYRTSTLHTESTERGRKNATAVQKQYWLTPGELVELTADEIIHMKEGVFACKDVIKHNPDYHPSLHKIGAKTALHTQFGVNGESEKTSEVLENSKQIWRALKAKHPPKKPDGELRK